MVWFVNYDNEEEVSRQNINTFHDERQGQYCARAQSISQCVDAGQLNIPL